MINFLSMRDLKNLTVVCGFQQDSAERILNLRYVVEFFKRNFTNYSFLVIENVIGKSDLVEPFDEICDGSVKDIFKYDKEVIIHPVHLNDKTESFNIGHFRNLGAAMAKSELVLLYDVDVIISPDALVSAINSIEQNKCQAVYPYNGHFVLLDKQRKDNFMGSNYDYQWCFQNYLNVPHSIGGERSGFKIANTHSNGGALLIRRSTFLCFGGYSPEMTGWGYEDNEFHIRLSRLGTVIHYVRDFPLFHLFHDVATNCPREANPMINVNRDICVLTQSRSPSELRELCAQYVQTNHKRYQKLNEKT